MNWKNKHYIHNPNGLNLANKAFSELYKGNWGKVTKFTKFTEIYSLHVCKNLITHTKMNINQKSVLKQINHKFNKTPTKIRW